MQFEPVSIYDKPGILLSQIVENEASLSNLKNLALSPDSLTPEERTDLGVKLMGGESVTNPAMKAAVGILTNPFAWLYVLTSPAGASFAKHGIGLFTETAEQAMKRIAKTEPGFLQSIGFLTPNQASGSGGVTTAALQQFMNAEQEGLELLKKHKMREGVPTTDIFNKTHNLPEGINSKLYLKGSREYIISKRIEAAWTARAGGDHLSAEDIKEIGQLETVIQSKRSFKRIDYVVDEEATVKKAEIFKRKKKAFDPEKDSVYMESPQTITSDDYYLNKKKDKVKGSRWWKKLNEYKEKEKEYFEANPGATTLPPEIDALHPRGPRPPKYGEYTDTYEVGTKIDDEGVASVGFREPGGVGKQEVLNLFDEFEGLEEMFEGNRNAKREMLVRALGVEDGSTLLYKDDRGVQRKMLKFKLDEGKYQRLLKGLRRSLKPGDAKSQELILEGREALTMVLGPENVRALNKGLISPDELDGQIRQILTKDANNPWYSPRNMSEQYAFPNEMGALRKGGKDQLHMELNYGEVTDSVIPRKSSDQYDMVVDPEDYKYLAEFADPNDADGILLKKIEENDEMLEIKRQQDKPISVRRLLGPQADDKYIRDMNNTYAFHTQQLDPGIAKLIHGVGGEGLGAHHKGIQNIAQEVAPDKANVASDSLHYVTDKAGKTTLENPTFGKMNFGADSSVAEAVHFSINTEMDEYTRNVFKETFLPMMTHGHTDIRHLVSNGMFHESKRAIRALSQMDVIQEMKGKGDNYRQFVEKLEYLADPATGANRGAGLSAEAAKYFYVTHLGMNLGSIALNMTQPFLLAGTSLGFRAIARGYQRAAGEMLDYFKDRYATHGFKKISREQRNELIDKHFIFGRETGLKATTDEILDKLENTGRSTRNESLEYWTVELPLKGFEKSEWFNRSVAAHAVKDSMGRGAQPMGEKALARTVEKFTEETQFGQNRLNTPEIVLNNRFMNNPLMRQFLSFGLRSFTGLVHTLPEMGGGFRHANQANIFRLIPGAVKNDRITNPMLVRANDLIRGMGMSAIVYEGAKGLIGADLSRGLFVESSFGLLGVGNLTGDKGDVLPIPPVVDIPIEAAMAFASDDTMQMKQAAARMFPGGIAFSRALGVAPKLPDELGVFNLQRRYVDWEAPLEDGSVPVYDWDGTLIKYTKPGDAILQAMGVDLGRFERSGGLDRYLMANREEIIQMRRSYIEALETNEFAEAEKISKAYESKHGMPLLVTEQQLRSYRDQRSTPRTMRILKRMDKGTRESFQELVASSSGQTLPAHLLEGSTQAQRMTDAQAKEQEGGERQFNPFVGFEGF